MLLRLRAIVIAFFVMYAASAFAQQQPGLTPESVPPSVQGGEVPGNDQAKSRQEEQPPGREVTILKSAEPPQDEKPGGHRADSGDRIGADKGQHESYERTIANFTVALAIATFLLMFATGALWWETRKLAIQAKVSSADTRSALAISQASYDVATSNAAKEYRAYVRLAVNGGTVAIGRKPEFEIKVVNYGRTPALNGTAASVVVVRDFGWKWPDDDDEDDPQGQAPNFTVHPGDESVKFYADCDGILNERLYQAIKVSAACIYGRVIFKYQDVFGESRKTVMYFDFSGDKCFELRAPRQSWTGNAAS